MQPEAFFKKLLEVGAIKVDTRPGHGFPMRIHDTNPEAPLSPIYINLRTPDNPKPGPLTLELVSEIGRILLEVAEDAGLSFDGICGIPHAGVPLADAFHLASLTDAEGGWGDIPVLQLQKGVQNGIPVFTGIADNCNLDAINTDESRNNAVLLIDDAITYAGTKKSAVQAFIGEGYDVNSIVVFCDREQGGSEKLKAQGISVKSAFTLSNIVNTLRAIGSISPDDCAIVLEYLVRTRV